jgi:catechol 2,3-dioxygenase-like lactoylglutathione lyase family enzyme
MEIVGILHPALRVDPGEAAIAAARHFYAGVLGLTADPRRPTVPGFPGFFFQVGPQQLHIMGARGVSPLAQAPDRDPAQPHVALAVADLQAAKRELADQGVAYWTVSLIGTEQVFLHDPAGNLLELQQAR